MVAGPSHQDRLSFFEGFDCQLAIRAANFESKLISPFSEKKHNDII
jgi:hypothetical protein